MGSADVGSFRRVAWMEGNKNIVDHVTATRATVASSGCVQTVRENYLPRSVCRVLYLGRGRYAGSGKHSSDVRGKECWENFLPRLVCRVLYLGRGRYAGSGLSSSVVRGEQCWENVLPRLVCRVLDLGH